MNWGFISGFDAREVVIIGSRNVFPDYLLFCTRKSDLPELP